MTFEVGDVVRLKSGGYPMTIGGTSKDSDYLYHCHWHDEDGTRQTEQYWEDMLVKATATDLVTGQEIATEDGWRQRMGLK